MKFKYVLIASLMLAILVVGAVSATDTISEDIISDSDDTPLEITDNDVYTTKESSFSNLSDEIENTGMSLDLNQDYAFNNETDNKNGIVTIKSYIFVYYYSPTIFTCIVVNESNIVQC